MKYLDRIHEFLGAESSNLRMASVICFLYLYSVIMEELLLPMEIQARTIMTILHVTLTNDVCSRLSVRFPWVLAWAAAQRSLCVWRPG